MLSKSFHFYCFINEEFNFFYTISHWCKKIEVIEKHHYSSLNVLLFIQIEFSFIHRKFLYYLETNYFRVGLIQLRKFNYTWKIFASVRNSETFLSEFYFFIFTQWIYCFRFVFCYFSRFLKNESSKRLAVFTSRISDGSIGFTTGLLVSFLAITFYRLTGR